MAKTKSKQLANLLTFTTASIDVVSGSLIPDAANLYNIGSSTLPYKSGSFQHIEASNTAVVEGDLLVSRHIKHDGDLDTLINFTDNRIQFEAGSLTMFGIQKKGSAPHQVTVNNGANNVDFVVKDSSNNEVIKVDASAGGVDTFTLKEHSTTPTVKEGGLMYSGSNFYLGFD